MSKSFKLVVRKKNTRENVVTIELYTRDELDSASQRLECISVYTGISIKRLKEIYKQNNAKCRFGAYSFLTEQECSNCIREIREEPSFEQNQALCTEPDLVVSCQ